MHRHVAVDDLLKAKVKVPGNLATVINSGVLGLVGVAVALLELSCLELSVEFLPTHAPVAP